MRIKSIVWVVLGAVIGCGGSKLGKTDGGTDAGSPQMTTFGTSTSDPETSIPVENSTENFRLVGRLSSGGGKRTLVLIVGSLEIVVAPPGWNLPPVGLMSISETSESGSILVCWNHLAGAEPTPDSMPHPSQGLDLFCRHRSPDGTLGPQLSVGFVDAPSWLQGVGINQSGEFSVSMLRDHGGNLFGRQIEGDGVYSIDFSGATPTEVTPLDVLGQPAGH